MYIMKEPPLNRFLGLLGVGFDMDHLKIKVPGGSKSVEFELKLSMWSLEHKNKKSAKDERLQCTNFITLSCPKNGGKFT